MILLIDNYDSFTYNLCDYVIQTGLECIVKRNDEIGISYIDELKPQGIILSPGPGRPEDHPLIHEVLKNFYTRLPILGVCLGYQAIGQFFGMELIKAPFPVHGKVSNIIHQGEGIFQGIPSPLSITRYHSLIFSKQSDGPFLITSHTEDGIPMSAEHEELPLWGVQFHPEAILTQHGLKMIKNWASLVEAKN